MMPRYCPYCGEPLISTDNGWICEECGMTEEEDEVIRKDYDKEHPIIW